jgi:hypothetical protein
MYILDSVEVSWVFALCAFEARLLQLVVEGSVTMLKDQIIEFRA